MEDSTNRSCHLRNRSRSPGSNSLVAYSATLQVKHHSGARSRLLTNSSGGISILLSSAALHFSGISL